MQEFLLENLGVSIAVAVASLGTIIEVSPIKINPWTSVLSWFGKRLNKDLLKKMDDIDKQGKENKDSIATLKSEMEEKFQQAEHEADEKEARRMRATIVSFADSCRLGVRHTKIQFQNVFRDYDYYVSICEKRNLKNHFIEEEMEYVHEVYQLCLSQNKFV